MSTCSTYPLGQNGVKKMNAVEKPDYVEWIRKLNEKITAARTQQEIKNRWQGVEEPVPD